MDKPENANLQQVKNAKGVEPSPNTKRRMKFRPKLHINIPFFKNGGHHNDPSPDELSRSLPIQSNMPSKFHDPALCRRFEDPKEVVDNKTEDAGTPEPEDIILFENVGEDEADSEKHQSDLEENEKDGSSDLDHGEQRKVGFAGEIDESCKSAEEDNETNANKDAVTAPVKIPQKCCLKSCLKKSLCADDGRPRASTYPGPVDCLEASFKRHVSFSPDTMEPRTRNCKYREWIERKCPPKSPPVNIKHEKRKCQLQQMRKVNLSDYMSKSYGGSYFCLGSFGGDMLM